MGAGAIGAPMARLLANLIVMGSGMIGPMGREFMKAYNQALQNGGAAAASKAAKATARRVTGMAESEARLVLNVKEKGDLNQAEVVEAHEKLTAMNDPKKGGSEFLNQKFTVARDTLLPEEMPKQEPPKSE